MDGLPSGGLVPLAPGGLFRCMHVCMHGHEHTSLSPLTRTFWLRGQRLRRRVLFMLMLTAPAFLLWLLLLLALFLSPIARGVCAHLVAVCFFSRPCLSFFCLLSSVGITTGAEDQPPFQVPRPGNASPQLARRARPSRYRCKYLQASAKFSRNPVFL